MISCLIKIHVTEQHKKKQKTMPFAFEQGIGYAFI